MLLRMWRGALLGALVVGGCTSDKPPEPEPMCEAEGVNEEVCGVDAFCLPVEGGGLGCRELCAYGDDCSSYCCEATTVAGELVNACGSPAGCMATQGAFCEQAGLVYCRLQEECPGGRFPGACLRLFTDDCCTVAGTCGGTPRGTTLQYTA